jgi:aminoglycoside phosphotransferase (APT) family kinase protein
VWVSPADPALPQLPAALEHPFVERAMRAAGRRGALAESCILAHRFGRRACFRVELPSSSFLGRVYARRGDENLVAALGLLAAHSERIRALVPRVMFHDRDRRFVALTWLDGASLQEKVGAPPLLGAAAAGSAARAWQRVPVEGLVRHGTAEELETIRRFARRVAVVRPALATELDAGIAALAASAAAHRDGPPVLAHRDLHDKQIVLGRSGVGVIDWDLAAASPPALDPGNFLAHLRLRVLQYRLPSWHARVLRRAFLTGYTAEGGGLPEDLAWWETLALLRLAAVYALRPAWPGLAGSLLDVVRRTHR